VHYLVSRYPSAASTPPFELYDESKAKKLIECARRLVNFVEEALK